MIESPTLRAQYVERVDVLDKVKALSLLSDGVHMTTELVADYYEVEVETIKSVVRRNRQELERNGLKRLEGEDLREFERVNLTPSPNRRSLNIFNRRAILNVGQMLTESAVAKDVRAYLLNVEEVATHEQRSEAIERVHLAKARVELLIAGDGYLDPKWQRLRIQIHTSIGLGEEPEIPDEDLPLYVPDFLKSKGLTQAQIRSAQSWFGRRVVKVALAEQRPMPAKRAEDTVSGAVRETYAWTRRDLPLFEEVWDMYYAGEYARDEQAELFAGSDA
ncbi:hypothetical protein SAMN05421811_103290 [Nonomuraea wenchangensis]|uniref:Uncharacterized protein n=2 Tax=Nonomuraea wenchangensis TaxID=568860 RepID=A0A1I0F1N4_9ACTN|nr:hypothetical protein SAMN05421811_103290 [Nonomuraea wenchangensis]